MPSARTGAVPDASSKNVTAIILIIVFFMFSPGGGFDFLGKSIAAGCARKSKKCVFSNLPKVSQVLAADGFGDMLVCQRDKKETVWLELPDAAWERKYFPGWFDSFSLPRWRGAVRASLTMTSPQRSRESPSSIGAGHILGVV